MPIKVVKYLCQFRCGRLAKSSVSEVQTHEAKCWNNPSNKTCKTCKYEHYSKQVEDYGMMGSRSWKERHCFHPDGDKITEEVYESLKIDDLHIKPVENCPFWEQK